MKCSGKGGYERVLFCCLNNWNNSQSQINHLDDLKRETSYFPNPKVDYQDIEFSLILNVFVLWRFHFEIGVGLAGLFPQHKASWQLLRMLWGGINLVWSILLSNNIQDRVSNSYQQFAWVHVNVTETERNLHSYYSVELYRPTKYVHTHWTSDTFPKQVCQTPVSKQDTRRLCVNWTE